MKRLILFALGVTACTGATSDVATTPAKAGSAVSADLIAQTWQVRLAVDAARAPFEGRAGWVAFLQGRRAESLQAFTADADPGAQARVHAEYAAIYRQAALLGASATAQVYGADAQPTDPLETSYLLGVAGALLGDQALTARLGSASASKVAGLSGRDAAWKDWAAAGAAWPPDMVTAAAPGAPTAPTAGRLPDAGVLPHYVLPEQGESTTVDAADLGALWALSRWHEAAAIAASPENEQVVRLWIDPWRLPPELRAPAAVVAIPDTFLFMSAMTTAGDAAFFSDLERDGVSAVAAHASDSPYAVIVARCTEAERLSVDCVLDEAAALGTAIEDAMAKAAGKEDGFHRPFADFARVGVLRAADRTAWKLEDREGSGRLRINALDRTTGTARDPVFLLSVAAWDAGNRNSVRAEELVHGLLTEVPGLEAARLPLDALHIRLSRNAAPGRPMH
ncbi:MAG: hypothetical protein Q8P18_09165 [Pseudomonadota bacterium]|nr:hypothetical protein [Pseudomonadota bacterium]